MHIWKELFRNTIPKQSAQIQHQYKSAELGQRHFYFAGLEKQSYLSSPPHLPPQKKPQ